MGCEICEETDWTHNLHIIKEEMQANGLIANEVLTAKGKKEAEIYNCPHRPKFPHKMLK